MIPRWHEIRFSRGGEGAHGAMRGWNGWQVISPGLLARLPEVPGVFELATLVRSVLYIGAASGLQSEIRRALGTPGVQLRAHCLRYEANAEPAHLVADRLKRYRQSHGGALPPAQPPDLVPAHLVPISAVREALAAEERSFALNADQTIFLRVSSS